MKRVMEVLHLEKYSAVFLLWQTAVWCVGSPPGAVLNGSGGRGAQSAWHTSFVSLLFVCLEWGEGIDGWKQEGILLFLAGLLFAVCSWHFHSK